MTLAGSDLRHVVIDGLPVTGLDATGLFALHEVEEALRERGIVLSSAGRAKELTECARRRALESRIRIFPTLRAAVREFSPKLAGSAPAADPVSDVLASDIQL